MFDRTAFIENESLFLQEQILSRLFVADRELVILDIGACEGESSIRYARMFPNSVIYAFEPLSGNISRINANIKRYACENVHAVELALSDRKGTSAFHMSSGTPDEYSGVSLDWDFGNKSSSLLAPNATNQIHPWLKFHETVPVATDRLDSFCIANDVDHIDFIHIDVQGAELKVLDGAGPALFRTAAIWMEVEAVPLYRDQPLRNDVERFMEARGFQKVADTVNEVAGDQFWLNSNALR